MLNPRSPIVNQVMNPGYNMYPGNFTVGYNGYNPMTINGGYQGYYGIQYNNYNPWYQAELQKQQLAYEKQVHLQQVNELKRASKLAHAENGSSQMSDEFLNKRFDSDYQYVGVDPELLQTQRHAAEMSRYRFVEYDQNAAQRYTAISNYHNKFVNQDCDLQEFLSQAGELYVDCMLREQKHRDRNLNGIYDSNAYRKLISQNNPNPYSGIFSKNIDDNSIGMPIGARQKFEAAFVERRAAFMAELGLNNTNAAGGV